MVDVRVSCTFKLGVDAVTDGVEEAACLAGPEGCVHSRIRAELVSILQQVGYGCVHTVGLHCTETISILLKTT